MIAAISDAGLFIADRLRVLTLAAACVFLVRLAALALTSADPTPSAQSPSLVVAIPR